MRTRRALLSVSDKAGLLDFVRGLRPLGFEMIATGAGGTARALQEAGVPVTTVEEWTGLSSILDGRVKTLHPAIFGGILARDSDRDNHCQAGDKRNGRRMARSGSERAAPLPYMFSVHLPLHQRLWYDLLDLEAAWIAAIDFEEPTVVIVKHLNPCGIASRDSAAEAFHAALALDPGSAFGGVIACNRAFAREGVEALGILEIRNSLPAPSVLASDAFFPFPDSLEIAARAGVRAVVQPGGSVRDAEASDEADRHGMAMCFTGIRRFRH